MRRNSWMPKHYTNWKLHDKTLIDNVGAMPDKQLAELIGCSVGAIKSRVQFLGISSKGWHRLTNEVKKSAKSLI